MKRKPRAVLYRLYKNVWYCTWYWPPHLVVKQIEEWRRERAATRRKHRRTIYDAMIGAAKGQLRECAWNPRGPQDEMPRWVFDWSTENFHEDMPLWAIKGLGAHLVDDLNDSYTPQWKRVVNLNPDGSVHDIYDQIYIPGEGWHSWAVTPGKNATYHGCKP